MNNKLPTLQDLQQIIKHKDKNIQKVIIGKIMEVMEQEENFGFVKRIEFLDTSDLKLKIQL